MPREECGPCRSDIFFQQFSIQTRTQVDLVMTHELSNEYLIAKIGVNAAEDGMVEV